LGGPTSIGVRFLYCVISRGPQLPHGPPWKWRSGGESSAGPNPGLCHPYAIPNSNETGSSISSLLRPSPVSAPSGAKAGRYYPVSPVSYAGAPTTGASLTQAEIIPVCSGVVPDQIGPVTRTTKWIWILGNQSLLDRFHSDVPPPPSRISGPEPPRFLAPFTWPRAPRLRARSAMPIPRRIRSPGKILGSGPRQATRPPNPTARICLWPPTSATPMHEQGRLRSAIAAQAPGPRRDPDGNSRIAGIRSRPDPTRRSDQTIRPDDPTPAPREQKEAANPAIRDIFPLSGKLADCYNSASAQGRLRLLTATRSGWQGCEIRWPRAGAWRCAR
jgi:hypothetical protein